jgi:hypothetical protein
MKRLTDPTFRYVSAAATDLRKTFAKARKALKQNVVPIQKSEPIRKRA